MPGDAEIDEIAGIAGIARNRRNLKAKTLPWIAADLRGLESGIFGSGILLALSCLTSFRLSLPLIRGYRR
jgi:hypothetical protein